MGFIKILSDIKRAEKLLPEEKEELQKSRLEALISYARQNSPYYKELYKDLPQDFRLSNLPVTNKQEMLKHFDDWVTDRTVTLQKVNHFMENKDNIGRKLDGRYMVNTTSGSTGNPCVVLYDKQMQQVVDAMGAMRTFARKQDMKAYIKAGGKSMGLYADDGFYVAVVPYEKNYL